MPEITLEEIHQASTVNISLNVLKTKPKSSSLNDADSFDDWQPTLSKLGNRQRCQKP